MGVIEEVVAANRRAAAGVATRAPSPPTRGLAVLTCMDARIDPAVALGLTTGEAHVLRNAGGRVTDDVLRSLAASWHLLATRAVMVVHHTDCGMLAPDPEEVRRRLERAAGAAVGDLNLLTFADEEGAVLADVERIRSWALTPRDAEVRGFLYEVTTGLLREVAG